MNKLKATIKNQKHAGGLGRIEAVSGDYLFRLLVFEDMPTRKDGCDVYLLIKESEIALSKDKPIGLSISNQVECVISEIKKGEILCEIDMRFGDEKLVSIITSDSADRLSLVVGDTVYALIKANEIYLESMDD
jgi:molybdopterin-binding protein